MPSFLILKSSWVMSEMGKHLYENGRMNNKLNTFYDFNENEFDWWPWRHERKN
jgi:hypothetical protein